MQLEGQLLHRPVATFRMNRKILLLGLLGYGAACYLTMMLEHSMGGFSRDFPAQLRACLTKHSTVQWDGGTNQYRQDHTATELYMRLTSRGVLSAFTPRIPTRYHLVSESFLHDAECHAPALVNSIPFRHIVWTYDTSTGQGRPLPDLPN